MVKATYDVSTPGDPAQGLPAISAAFGRVTVLIGSNGSGKSKILRNLVDANAPFGTRSVTYVEGGRVIQLPLNIRPNMGNFEAFATTSRAEEAVRDRKTDITSSRVYGVLVLLDRRAADTKIRHSDTVTQWIADGSRGQCPEPEESPLSRLFQMFSSVFPDITLSVDEESKELRCQKNGNTYAASLLSDGERQAFFILADIALTTPDEGLLIVDEPELNLNPLLAERLWNTIEDQLPNAVFIYGTHSISFAMRHNVDQVIALSTGGRPPIVIDNINQIPPHDAREFLGAIPAILSAPGAVAVEGIDTSFDGGFYRWILGRPELAVVPLGGNTDVKAAVARKGIWENLAPTVQLVGVIDRDYRSDDPLAADNSACVVMDYHEAESYLLAPSVLHKIAAALGTAEQIPTPEEIQAWIFSYFQENLYRVAANRMAIRAQIRLNVSLPSAVFRNGLNEASLRELIEKEAATETAKAERFVGPDATMKLFNEELQRCERAISDEDLQTVLRLVPGKELLVRLAPRVGCKNTAAVARAAYKHLNPTDEPELKLIRDRILAALES